jgi:hypothetical protein
MSVPPLLDAQGKNLNNGYLDPTTLLTIANPLLDPPDYSKALIKKQSQIFGHTLKTKGAGQ